MPQMFPTSWIFLFILFSIIMLITYKKLYVSFNQTPIYYTQKLPKKITNWLW